MTTLPVGELTLDQRMTLIEARVNRIESNLEGAPVLPARAVFTYPVGEGDRKILAPWWVAVGYAENYNGGQFHTGLDLNLSAYADSGKPVFACADGVIRFAGRVDAAWLSMVVVEHTLEDARMVWSRYAHIDPIPLVKDSPVKRGELLGYIADYGAPGPAGDHLHFDLAWIDLGAKPGDWPGTNYDRVIHDYINSLKFIPDRLPA